MLFFPKLLVIFIILAYSYGITINLKDKNKCYTKFLNPDDQLRIAFTISSADENSVDCEYTGPNGEVLFETRGQSYGQSDINTLISGTLIYLYINIRKP